MSNVCAGVDEEVCMASTSAPASFRRYLIRDGMASATDDGAAGAPPPCPGPCHGDPPLCRPGSAGRSNLLKVEPDTEPDADPDGVEQEVPGSAHSNDGSEVPSPEVTQPLELDRPFG